ncbi:MAG: hypothetical protein K0U20_08770 [Proteobacteria bacterium]|nr:hypothetical protein [Pseudomonadota bacterium]
MKVLNDYRKFKHGYELETDKGDLDVYANNRAQARRFAEKAGYVVYSVNFTG